MFVLRVTTIMVHGGNVVYAGRDLRQVGLLLTILVRRAQQEPKLIALHVTPLPSFIHMMEAIVGILAQTGSGETQPLDNVYLATVVELVHTAAKPAQQEQVAVASPAFQGLFFIVGSASVLVLMDSGGIRKRIDV